MNFEKYFFLQMPIMYNRKIPVITGIIIIFIVIIDLLMTRQILPYTNDMETLMFILTVFIGYGMGSWLLLGYITQVSKEIRSKSRIINIMHWIVIIIQFSLFLILLSTLFNNNSNRFLSPLIFAVSSVTGSIVLGLITYKLFSWYRLSKYKNLVILLYGIAAFTLALSILEDAGTKLLLVQIIEEKSPPGATI
jgi:hypothetical protein